MHLPIRPALLVFLAASASGRAERDPGEALERARSNLQSMTRRLAKYACIETVDRSYFDPPPDVHPGASCSVIRDARERSTLAPELSGTDRLRLEVTVSEGHEIHAWPGATRFDTRDVDEIIHQGPIGTGSFGTHLIGVFDNPGVDFHYVGTRTENGQAMMEYSYHVSLEASRYRVKTGNTWKMLPYDGTFWLDAGTLELRRFTVQAAPLPAGSSMCQLNSSLDYQNVRIGDGDVLLPRQGRLEIGMEDATETHNVTTFADCREYQAASELHFDTGSDVAGATARPVVRSAVMLPIGLPVVLALEAPIDTGKAAAGDLVSAKVVKPVVRPGSKEVLIPAGAVARGRITRLERHLLPRPYFLISISYNRLVQGDVSSPFAAKYDSDKELAKNLGAELRSRARGLEYWDVGTFLFPSNKPTYLLPAGFESKWETLATPSR